MIYFDFESASLKSIMRNFDLFSKEQFLLLSWSVILHNICCPHTWKDFHNQWTTYKTYLIQQPNGRFLKGNMKCELTKLPIINR